MTANRIVLADGIELYIDPEKFTVHGGFGITLGDNYSNDVKLTLDLNIHDVVEETESKIANIVEVRKR